MEYKGGYRQFRAKTIVVTSINHPDSMYANTGECRNQLARRLTSVTDVSEVGGNTKPPTKMIRRGRAAVLELACLIRSPSRARQHRAVRLWGPCFCWGLRSHRPGFFQSPPLCRSAGAPKKNTRGSPSAWRTLITCSASLRQSLRT